MGAKPRESGIHWDDLRLLLLVARGGSFLAAGREAEAATSTLSRRLARLERDVGTRLLERRSDGVRLTEAGQRLAQTAEALELQLTARLRDLPATARGLEGTIRVSTGDGFSAFLVRAIQSFGEKHPAVSFEVAVETRAADLVRREADLAIRTGSRREASLVYRPLGRLEYGLWASSAYLARRGVPRGEKDLAQHDFVGFAGPMERLPIIRWLRQRGVTRFAVRATSFGAFLEAARVGLGIAALPGELGKGLTRVVPQARPDPLPVHLVLHPEARRLPHVKAFAEHLVAAFPASEKRRA